MLYVVSVVFKKKKKKKSDFCNNSEIKHEQKYCQLEKQCDILANIIFLHPDTVSCDGSLRNRTA